MFGKKRRYSSTLHAPAPGPVAPWAAGSQGVLPLMQQQAPHYPACGDAAALIGLHRTLPASFHFMVLTSWAGPPPPKIGCGLRQIAR